MQVGNVLCREKLNVSDNRGEKLRSETVEVYEELGRFYKKLHSRGKCEISIGDLLANIEGKIAALRGVSSLEKCRNISPGPEEDNYEDIARRRHEKYLSSFGKYWWEKLDDDSGDELKIP